MPIDPSLIQRFMSSQQPVQVPDPMANAAKLMQIRGMMDEQQMRQMQMQQQRNQMAENEQLKQDFAAANGDPGAIRAALMKRGRVKEAKEISSAALAQEKAQHEAQKAKLELGVALSGQQLPVLTTAREAIAKNPANAQQIWEQAKATMAKNASDAGVDTSKTDDPALFPGLDFLDTKIGYLTSTKDKLEQTKAAHDAAYKQWQMQHGDKELAETQRHNVKMENKPNVSTLMMGPQGTSDPSQPLPDGGMEAIAQAIARKEQAPLVYSSRNPFAPAINARAAAIGGGQLTGAGAQATHQKALADFNPGGNSGKTINALNTMTEHLGTMEEAIRALDSGNIPAANRAAQAIGIQFGSDKATNAQAIKSFLSGEVAKVASGGHLTDSEIRKTEDNIKISGSPAQAMGALRMMKEIAGGKLYAINQDYHRITGKNLEEDNFLTPGTAKAFKSVAGSKSENKGGGAASVEDLLKDLGH